MAFAPLAVFAFNRPRHLQDCLAALAKCPELGSCAVHICCDGPRGPMDEPSVAETRNVARRWAMSHGATLDEKPINIGLARSIIEKTSSLCDEYGRAIVVEDDLVVSPLFVRYMLDGLSRYEAEPSVYQVAGYMFRARHPPQPASFFLPMVTTWGWATWLRAWKGVDWTAAGAAERLVDQPLRRAFDLDGSYPYTDFLLSRLAGENQSWGILWWWHVFSRGGISLFPARTLVANKGFDGTGYHCSDGDWRGEDQLDAGRSAIALPSRISIDQAAFRRIVCFIQNNNRPKQASWLRRLWGMMGGKWKRWKK